MGDAKVCSKCKVEKALNEYYSNPDGRDGLFAHCKQCHKDAVRRYRAANPERVAAFIRDGNVRRYRDTKEQVKMDRDRAREAMRRRIAEGENFGMDGKTMCCRMCKLDRPVDDFHRSSSHKTGRQSVCKYCNSQRNKDSYRKGRRELLDFLGGRCACCGEDEPLFLQIDHVHGGGGQERRAKGSLAALRARVMRSPSDFQVLCANCHLVKSSGEVCPHKTRRRA